MREKLADLADASVDAIVTDPPYGLGFMGKDWDHGVPGEQFWRLLMRVAKPGAHMMAFGGSRTFHRLWCAVEDAGWEIRDTLMWLHGEGFPKSSNQDGAWEGWGTALKPAFEPILMARKPLLGTVPQNLHAHGVGALNIDACRVPASAEDMAEMERRSGVSTAGIFKGVGLDKTWEPEKGGRWPANVLHDGSDEVVAAFPYTKSGAYSGKRGSDKFRNTYSAFKGVVEERPVAASEGSAARFFWCPKASRDDRNEGLDGMPKQAVNWSSGEQSPGTFQSENTESEMENFHPTVKPTELMRYLVRLITPKDGLVLDPFMGSGSTGKAAVQEGAHFIGIELDEAYLEIARRRISGALGPLFAWSIEAA